MHVTTDRVLKFDYFETKYYETTNRLYFGLWASNKKNKTTFLSETLKVEENKVVLFFLKNQNKRDMAIDFISKTSICILKRQNEKKMASCRSI